MEEGVETVALPIEPIHSELRNRACGQTGNANHVTTHKTLLPIIVVISALAAIASGDEERKPAAWLQYENTGSRDYARLNVTLFTDHSAKVRLVRNSREQLEYSAKLTSAETAWIALVLRTTDFANPNRLESEAMGGHQGITTIRARVDARDLQATFGRDESFDDLSRSIFRLVRQAELIKRLQTDHHAYDVLSGIRDNGVLQPAEFVEPLITYIQQEKDQLDHALVALALVSTPETWGGVLARTLEQATDTPFRAGSPFSRRRLLLNVITSHPFYVDLPDSHYEALIRIYREQSVIESRKADDDAAHYVWLFKHHEERLKSAK